MPIVNHFRQVKWLGHVRCQYENGSQATTRDLKPAWKNVSALRKRKFSLEQSIHSFVFVQCCLLSSALLCYHLPTPHKNVNLLFYFKNECIIFHRERVRECYGWFYGTNRYVYSDAKSKLPKHF